ncbi:LytR family transcriptional regulator [Treponema ruminis]|uniref:Anionic cell wall polymer biosynthesis LytR-Cps2A-Psr (LCP) family protein n=1 Tax=Treponema ruminis TaxID=744515 RepID=A0A7W8G9U9_9SPIR|nr:LCP family protein [Treponema ruminis]MBB5226371.1 anionic cell wall polymer biosynthesis LytR-Cps2A-Psr (LCP) family protein [Treponema ruminis]QSI02724.1 LytR family transcriptional regulator [Treponema ruminis]
MKINNPNSNKGAFLLLLIFVILISVTVGLALSLRVSTVDENLKTDRVIKTLVVMEDKNRVLFTDVFIYYPVSQRGALINILENTGAIFSSLGRVDSIESVYLEKGIDSYKSEIEKLVGQSIPFYINLNLTKFGQLTDMLGGMKVFIPSPIDAKNDEGDRWLLPSGVVSLDGDKIQSYLNYERSDENEEDLIERRQNVILAFFAALSRNEKIIRDKKSFAAISKRMDSNLDDKEFHRLVSIISQVDSEHLTPQTITGSKRVVDGKTLLFPYYDGQLIKDVFKQVSNSLISLDNANVNRTYVLEIQNGTTVQGLARNTMALLQSAGYDILTTGNADSNDYEKTVIINHIGNAEIAKSLGDFIHCSNIVEESVSLDADSTTAASNVDFTIILGKDFDGRYVKK